MPAAAFAVHQLRYLLADGGGASRELGDTGHAYLSSVTPWLVLVLAVWLGALVGRLARAWRFGEAEAGRRSGLWVWVMASAALVLIYAGQEFLEGLFATGHPSGLAGVFGHGGLWALPAALAVGGFVALAIHGGRAVVALAARLSRARSVSRKRPAPVARPQLVLLPSIAPLAGGAPGRAPPPSR